MAQPNPRSGAARILVAAEEPQVRELFARKLRSAGYAVSEAGTGRQALVILRWTRFHILVLDWDMHDIDGFDVLKVVRSEMRHLRVVVFSGSTQGSFLQAAEWLGAAAAIDKRRAPRVLVATVKSLLP